MMAETALDARNHIRGRMLFPTELDSNTRGDLDQATLIENLDGGNLNLIDKHPQSQQLKCHQERGG
jgi:hypothetical protein